MRTGLWPKNGEDITPNGLLERFANDRQLSQIGGKATVGRGRCVRVHAGERGWPMSMHTRSQKLAQGPWPESKYEASADLEAIR